MRACADINRPEDRAWQTPLVLTGAHGAYGYARAMARSQTMVQLSDDLVETLDRVAARRGASRSGLIRELLWEGLRRDRDTIIGERIVAGYRLLPQGEPDDWGDVAASADASTEEVLRRLDAEERAAGPSSW